MLRIDRAELRAFLSRRLGVPGVLLLAATLCDLLIIGMVGFDSIGTMGAELWLLPGIVALSACALLAPFRPVPAAWSGAAVLLLSSALLVQVDAASYMALLADITFAETVAGVELLYYCVRLAPPLAAVVTSPVLISATVAAMALRTGFSIADGLTSTLFTGAVLISLTVLVALLSRQPDRNGQSREYFRVLRNQWPLMGVLTAALFLEMFYTAVVGNELIVLLLSLVSAVIAMSAKKGPARAALLFSGLVLLSASTVYLGSLDYDYLISGGIPFGQIASGMAIVVTLVRQAPVKRTGVLVAVMAVTVGFVAILNLPGYSFDSVRALFAAALLTLGISVAVGMSLRSRDSERTRMVATAVTDAQTAERMALARELHDVVAHHVTGIVVQAQGARMLAEQDPRVAAQALGQIEHAGTDAMTAMRRLVRSMRGDAPAGASETSEQATSDPAADLRRLVEQSNHGVPVETDLDLSGDLPPEVTRSTLRLVQESLTNVGKHAENANRAWVTVRVQDGELYMRVADDGTGEHDHAKGDPGYGLIGMRERVELLRGRLTAGPAPEGGWQVQAWLPLHSDPERKDGQ